MKNTLLLLIVAVVVLGCTKREPGAAPKANAVNQAVASASSSTPTLAEKKYDGPFGLAMGILPDELERMGLKSLGKNSGGFGGTPPRPMDGVDTFVVVAYKTSGLCKIRAVVEVPVVNGTGDQLKAAVDRLADAMEVKYGKPSGKYDVVADRFKRNPEYWMLGLTDDSVVYAYGWELGKTAQPLPNDILKIEIGADAKSISTGVASMNYTFKNADACKKEYKALKAANL